MPRSNTILVIEEDASVRFMMREIARALDIAVETARSCRDGVRSLRERPTEFSILILNLRLCGEGKDDTVSMIRADAHSAVRNIPIVGLIEDSGESNAALLATARVNDCLHKPVTPAELLTLVDQYLPPLVAQR